MKLDPSNQLKIGELVVCGHQGFWRVTKIERRFRNMKRNGAASWNYDYVLQGKDEDEVDSWVHLIHVMGRTFKPAGPKPRKTASSAACCTVVTKELIEQGIKDAEVDYRAAVKGWESLGKLL